MRKVFQIALATYRESIRSKMLYSLLIFAAVLVLVLALFGSVTIGDQAKIVKDFGLFSMSFFTVAYAVISGAALLNKELTRKTVYNIMAKPVQRWEFLCGKYLGLLLTVGLMLALMGPALILFTALFELQLDFSLCSAFIMIFFQLIMICACTIFFSAIVVTPLLSGAFTFGVFIAGRSTDYLREFIETAPLQRVFSPLIECAYWLLPHLNRLDVSNQVVYGDNVTAAQLLYGFLYSAAYAGTLLVLAAFAFQRREFR